jgi:branched-chain amino acid transport system ATP-binding protein
MLEVENLTLRFGGVTALSEVSLALGEGEGVVGLIGPNGAGKSSFFSIISGLAPMTSGRVSVAGLIVGRTNGFMLARAGLARTFQAPMLAGGLSAIENVMLGLRHERGRSTKRAKAALEQFGVESRAGAYPASLTYGERKRVEFARAFASDPRLLLLDEPFAGLDATEQRFLFGAIDRLVAQGTTVLLVEHDMGVVMPLCARLIVLASGRVIADDARDSVRADRAVIDAYLGVAE